MALLASWKNTFMFVFVGASIAVSEPTFLTAQEEQGFDTNKYRIDLAARQRMLTQRIAKSICFIELGINVEVHHEELVNSFQLFDESLEELINGGGVHDIPPEDARRAIEALEAVRAEWEEMRPVMEEVIATDEISDENEEFILAENLVLLELTTAASQAIAQEHANPNETLMAEAVAVDIAGRQRMLTQKMAKEFCYVAAGHRVVEEREALKSTVGLFEASLAAITDGMPAAGIVPPPNDEIAAQLAVVAEVWAPMKEIYAKVMAEEFPTPEEIVFIEEESNHLLVEMNKAVQLYVNH